ncbi:MAG: polysaccharide deacetylase family protein [Candidatus Zhuqueibacterota bacterium]
MFFKDWYKREYPIFLYQKNKIDIVPAFCYHHVTANEFDDHLEYLEKNEYNTLTAQEFYEAQKAGAHGVERSVLITFDDGTRDVYDVVFPLLKKYLMKAVVFIIPGWVGKDNMLTWPQIQEMHQSGLVDFQSHSMNHPAIFVSTEVLDYYRPRLTNLSNWNAPVIQKNGEIRYGEAPSVGQPIYEFHSRFSDLPRFVPDENLQRHCQAYVQNNGGETFFHQKTWRENLNKTLEAWREEQNLSERFETIGEQVSNIRNELEASKQIIEEQLPGKQVEFFACPWNVTSALTNQLLRESNYKIAFIGIKMDPSWECDSSEFFCTKRISGDFVKCLPGRGRQSVGRVIFSKMIRRIFAGVNY